MSEKVREARRIMITVLNESVKAGLHQTAESAVIAFDALNYLLDCAAKWEAANSQQPASNGQVPMRGTHLQMSHNGQPPVPEKPLENGEGNDYQGGRHLERRLEDQK